MNETAKTIAVDYVIKPVIAYAAICVAFKGIDAVADRKARKLAKKADHFIK